MAAGGFDLFQVGDAGRVIAIGRLLDQDLAVADDGVERRAQLVAHVGEECRFGARGGLRLLARTIGLRMRNPDLARVVAEHQQRAAHVA